MSKKIHPAKSRFFANLDHYLGFLDREFYAWEMKPTGDFFVGLDGSRRQKFAVVMFTQHLNCESEYVRTSTTMVTTIYPESQTNLLDGWLREWQTTQERKA